MKSKTDKLFSGVETFVGAIGLVGILIITTGVIFRFILHMSIAWTDEFLRTSFIYAYFIGAATAFYFKGMMRLELLESNLLRKKRLRIHHVLNVFLEVVNFLFFGTLTVSVYIILMPYVLSGTTTSTSSTPAWVLPFGYGIGVLTITIIAFARVIKQITTKV